MNSIESRVTNTVVLLTLAWSGCVDAPVPEPATSEAYDSAGVRIVRLGPRTDSTYRVAELVYRTGWAEPDYGFDGIRDGSILRGGRAVIGDFGPRNVVTLSATGDVESIAGGEGQGPTEIGRIWALQLMQGDTVVVEDATNLRLSMYHDGAFVRGYPFDSQEAIWLSMVGVVGRNALMAPGGIPTSFPEPWFSAPIVLHPIDTERFDTLAHFDIAERPNPEGPRNPFRAWGRIGAVGDQVFIYRADRSRIDIRNADGPWVRSLRWTQDPVPVDDGVWATYAQRRIDVYGDSEAEAEERVSQVRSAAGPHLPLVDHVLGASDGRLWVADYAADRRPSRYWVVRVDGTELGWVEIPDGGRILDIRDDLVLVSQSNVFDVEAAVMFRLVPPS